ncbi:alpha/beta hydrolase [Roseovarius sp.]|uniref:alpha/beta hydrolase n=1 Tax=Roseovarius sp. TaxID=1486281 RepID=UPI002636AC59|nr:alpha/beta hydrolase [Roseovarius sp.]
MPRPLIHLYQTVLLVLMLALAGCGGPRPLAEVDAIPYTSGEDLKLYFITDRNPSRPAEGTLLYTPKRSSSMAFGTARLRPDENGKRSRLTQLHEALRFPATPLPFSQNAGVILPDRAATTRYGTSATALQAQLAQALRESGQDEVLLYVHGFNSSFAESVETLARIWQSAGQSPVPLAYSWPADNPGMFGYFKDRESGEFSIFHLKETLRMITATPGLGRFHIIAHSRGSDVVTTALRELVIETRAAGRNPRQSLRIENLILAAPDLDFGVVRQRLVAEKFGPAFGRITVYINPEDSALGLAQTLMTGTRFGRLSYSELEPNDREIFAQIGNVDFINVSAVTGKSSHGYFRNNPEVLMDIARVLQSDAPPDSPKRNLIHAEANFWRLLLPRDLRDPFDRNDP